MIGALVNNEAGYEPYKEVLKNVPKYFYYKFSDNKHRTFVGEEEIDVKAFQKNTVWERTAVEFFKYWGVTTVFVFAPWVNFLELAHKHFTIVNCGHGVSDKLNYHIGDTMEAAKVSRFIHFCAGQKDMDRIFGLHKNILPIEVGYPKLDPLYQGHLHKDVEWARLGLNFNEYRPVALYAPTYVNPLASEGSTVPYAEQVVKHLIENGYNVILKSHYYAKEKPFAGLQKYKGYFNLVTEPSVIPSMVCSDVFVGDVSTTNYEWLPFHRPAVFLDLGIVHLYEEEKRIYPAGEVANRIGDISDKLKVPITANKLQMIKDIEDFAFSYQGRAMERVKDFLARHCGEYL